MANTDACFFRVRREGASRSVPALQGSLHFDAFSECIRFFRAIEAGSSLPPELWADKLLERIRARIIEHQISEQTRVAQTLPGLWAWSETLPIQFNVAHFQRLCQLSCRRISLSVRSW